MKKFFLFAYLMGSALFAASQETTVSFTGVSLNGSYCPFDRVNVTNVTQGWSETLVYPDTVLILSGLGVEETFFSSEGIHIYPNPFSDFTSVEFGVPESGWVDVCVVGVDGVKVASWKGFVQAGIHQLRVTLEKPQMAFVVITTEKERYVGKLLHVGGGGVNEIDLCSASERSNESDQSGAGGDFTPGDIMSYEGVILNDGDVIYSNRVIQAQYFDETISLVFPVIEPGVEVHFLPYCQSFGYSFGTYTTFDAFGPQSWTIDYNTAHMTGYANNTNHANEDWLISSPVSITGVEDAKMTVLYICRYFHNINEEVTIWVSNDYVWNSDPATASWRQVPATLSAANNWNDFLTAEIALTEYVGQIINVAVRYISTDSSSGTIEIQSICIEEGTAGGSSTPSGFGMSIP